MKDERKDLLVKMNDLEKPMYEDRVRTAVRKQMFPEDEIAILRKAVAKLFTLVATLHPDEVTHEEFDEYFNLVEKIKEEQR